MDGKWSTETQRRGYGVFCHGKPLGTGWINTFQRWQWSFLRRRDGGRVLWCPYYVAFMLDFSATQTFKCKSNLTLEQTTQRGYGLRPWRYSKPDGTWSWATLCWANWLEWKIHRGCSNLSFSVLCNSVIQYQLNICHYLTFLHSSLFSLIG